MSPESRVLRLFARSFIAEAASIRSVAAAFDVQWCSHPVREASLEALALAAQVLVVVTAGWHVLCFDHNLKLLWDRSIRVRSCSCTASSLISQHISSAYQARLSYTPELPCQTIRHSYNECVSTCPQCSPCLACAVSSTDDTKLTCRRVCRTTRPCGRWPSTSATTRCTSSTEVSSSWARPRTSATLQPVPPAVRSCLCLCLQTCKQ